MRGRRGGWATEGGRRVEVGGLFVKGVRGRLTSTGKPP